MWTAAAIGLCSLDERGAELLEVVHGIPSEADLALLKPPLNSRVGHAEQPRGCSVTHIVWMLSRALGAAIRNGALH